MSESVTIRFEFLPSGDTGKADFDTPVISLSPGSHGLENIFSSWLEDDEERERFRNALSFDGFEYECDFLHYRSEDPLTVVLYQGSVSSGKAWPIARPPLLEILDDWEELLASKRPFTKTYEWD